MELHADILMDEMTSCLGSASKQYRRSSVNGGG